MTGEDTGMMEGDARMTEGDVRITDGDLGVTVVFADVSSLCWKWIY